MKRIFLALSAFLFLVIVAAIGGYLWLLQMMSGESNLAMRNEFWRVLGDRAIQLDRIGEVGRPRFFMSEVNIPKNVWEKIDDLSCASKISAKEVDLREYGLVAAGVKKDSPWIVYLFYFGPPPNFAAIISENGARQYFGPQKVLSTGSSNVPNLDYREEFDKFVAGRNFTWQSVECEYFTYTVIKEQ